MTHHHEVGVISVPTGRFQGVAQPPLQSMNLLKFFLTKCHPKLFMMDLIDQV